MSVAITGAYAGLLALLFLALSVRTIRLRQRLSIGIGDGGSPELLRAMRVHANFAEYVPLCLLLIALLELGGQPAGLVHGAGATLLLGRVLHAWGVSQSRERIAIRVAGMALTFAVLGGAALLLLGGALA